MIFSKPPLSQQDHLKLLITRGLIIEDEPKALNLITNVGYFRLTGYMYPFQLNDGTHNFKRSTSFNLIASHYTFDRKLRFLILDAIERIEVAFRALISDTFAMSYGSHWYTDQNLFKDLNIHATLLQKIVENCKNSEHQFIKSYTSKYTNPPLPPAWMVMETLTFGQVSVLFENLKGNSEKAAIASKFNTVAPIIESWLLSINSLRNFCAHHSRVWNRKFAIKPKIPQRKEARFLIAIEEDTNWQLFGILSCILNILNQINPGSTFKDRLKALFQEHADINIRYMGFKDSWLSEPIWQ